nr:thiol:disulfide interchange protein DsbA/DsbL [uncultured Massilia sp.]
MRLLRTAVLGACLSLSTLALASPSAPQNGVDYVTLAQPQPVQTAGKKVEVIEFFMYHCPVCNALEPGLEAWIRQQGDRITVRRVHFPFTGPADPEARLYLTLEALGKLDQMHAKVFKAVHVDRVRLNTDAAIIDWVSKNGVDRAAFLNAWNSFGVTMKLRQLSKIVADYKIDSAPTLVIDGRYVTSPSIVNKDLKTGDRNALFNATLQVATKLVDQAARSK